MLQVLSIQQHTKRNNLGQLPNLIKTPTEVHYATFFELNKQVMCLTGCLESPDCCDLPHPRGDPALGRHFYLSHIFNTYWYTHSYHRFIFCDLLRTWPSLIHRNHTNHEIYCIHTQKYNKIWKWERKMLTIHLSHTPGYVKICKLICTHILESYSKQHLHIHI